MIAVRLAFQLPEKGVMKYQAVFVHCIHSLLYQNSKLSDDCHQSVGDFQINKICLLFNNCCSIAANTSNIGDAREYQIYISRAPVLSTGDSQVSFTECVAKVWTGKSIPAISASQRVGF